MKFAVEDKVFEKVPDMYNGCETVKGFVCAETPEMQL